METQMKKGILEIFVLAIISKSDSYGYKIVNDLSRYVDASESTLYPILRRLEKENYLETYDKLFQSRNRKYYHITKKGIIRMNDFLKEWEDIQKIYYILKGE